MQPKEDYMDALKDWRAGAEKSLRAPYSWLALSGLHWLREGENTAGSGKGALVGLPERFPAEAGSFRLEGGQVRLQPAKGVPFRLNDEYLSGLSRALKPDASGEPDLIFLEDVRMMLIQRGEKLAMRVWDPQNPVRMNFGGRVWFDPDTKFRVRADVAPYEPPKQVVVDDIVGIQRSGEMQAALHFELDGQSYSLDAELLDSGAFYIIFKDATAGDSTYGAGRYLVSEVAEGDEVVIDFNRAYNPPCAFTNYATCPLPQPGNSLEVRIEAGERYREQG